MRALDLPADSAKLLLLADRFHHREQQDQRTISRGLSAIHKALRLRGAKYACYWRLARGYFLLADQTTERQLKLTSARWGAAYARAAARLDQRRVQGHYYFALNMALIARATGDVGLVKTMADAAQRARQLDERYDETGPLIFLGKLYLSAPPWPVSIGNPEEAVKLLRRALSLNPRPLTRVFLGQAYFESEDYQRAKRELERALRQPSKLPPKWRREAEDYLRRATEESRVWRVTLPPAACNVGDRKDDRTL
ncbi:MAG: tetratricopeptide repeat protein [Deltaproteobacteria bacterium]|nr:tetratricopeptide repeat protein [Deltaproteobacteria bacterium]